MRTLLMVVAVMALCTVAFADPVIAGSADAHVTLNIEQYCSVVSDADFVIDLDEATGAGNNTQTFTASANDAYDLALSLSMGGSKGIWSKTFGNAPATPEVLTKDEEPATNGKAWDVNVSVTGYPLYKGTAARHGTCTVSIAID